MFSKQNTLDKTDPEIWAAIQSENRRQEDHIELIASENYVSAAVLEAQGSDRKSTRLNSSHITISYAAFCLKKKWE